MKRVQAVDFLRGLTIMLMILVNTPGSWSYVYPPLLHAEWDGLTLADFVFPFFLFIVGISISIAYRHKKKDQDTYKKILIRSLKLIGLGLFLNTFLPYYPFLEESIRIPGVLQRIGIVFCVVSILYLNFNSKQLLIISSVLLLGYWIWLAYIPLPDGSLPTLERSQNNWANYIDSKLLKGHTWKPDYDPEGILSTFPAIVSAIIGVLIGETLIKSKKKPKFSFLIITGILLIVSGYILSIFFPINKALWSSSFVLVTSGFATLLLTIFYYFMDHKNYQFGNMVKYVGANAILIYFLSSFISKIFYSINLGKDVTIHQWLFENLFINEIMSKTFSSLLYAIAVVAFYTFFAYVLYKKRIFIKV